MAASPFERYARQMRVAALGPDGQRRLAEAHALVVGCGALGSVASSFLVRAGVGRVTLVDRDVVEEGNLHRQILFDEHDAANGTPKAVAAAARLSRANSQVQVHALVADVTAANVGALVEQVDVVVDGTDNFATRYLINDACVKLKKPWVYGGVIATTGMVLRVVPSVTPCFRCLFPQPPGPAQAPTCETAGVLGPVVGVVGALQASEAMRLLAGATARDAALVSIDVWDLRATRVAVGEPEPACRACGAGQFDFLEQKLGLESFRLCGSDAVQIAPVDRGAVDLADLAERVRDLGLVTANEHIVRLRTGAYELTVFADGRTVVKGTGDEQLARSLHARYVGA